MGKQEVHGDLREIIDDAVETSVGNVAVVKADIPAVGVGNVGTGVPLNLSIQRVRGRRDRLTKIDGAEDRENLLFGESVVDSNVADGACAGKADAGGEEGGCGELHGRAYKVRPCREGEVILLTKEPWYMEGTFCASPKNREDILGKLVKR